jgi:DNA polymerase III epsilon subunit-like protein
MVKILAFDTETTGLPPFQFNESDHSPLKKDGIWETWNEYNTRLNGIRTEINKPKTDLKKNPELWENYKETWPYIVQLSYILYDSDTHETVIQDMYINIPEKYTNADFLETTHPIVRTAIEAGLKQSERKMISEAIDIFMEDFKNADVVTGHNAMFDIDMLLAECTRSGNTIVFKEIMNTDKIYCTACKATNLVKIYYDLSKKPLPLPKMPKLNQAYFRIFGYAPREYALHNALIDVVVCLRVFYRMWFQGIQFDDKGDDIPICGLGSPDLYIDLKQKHPENPIIQLIDSITPDGFGLNEIDIKGLQFCQPIENDTVESIMTGIDIKIIKNANYAKSRHARYKLLTKDTKKEV